MRQHFSVLAAVCRDEHGHIIKVRTERTPRLSPLVSEMKAHLLACKAATSILICMETSSSWKATLLMHATGFWLILNQLKLLLKIPLQLGHLWQLQTHTGHSDGFLSTKNQMAHLIAQWATKNLVHGLTEACNLPEEITSCDLPDTPWCNTTLCLLEFAKKKK